MLDATDSIHHEVIVGLAQQDAFGLFTDGYYSWPFIPKCYANAVTSLA